MTANCAEFNRWCRIAVAAISWVVTTEHGNNFTTENSFSFISANAVHPKKIIGGGDSGSSGGHSCRLAAAEREREREREREAAESEDCRSVTARRPRRWLMAADMGTTRAALPPFAARRSAASNSARSRRLAAGRGQHGTA